MAQTSKKKNKLVKRTIQFSVLALIIGLLSWWLIPSPIAVNIDEVRFGSFSASIDALGYTRARDTVVIRAPVAGVLQRGALNVGDPVVVKQVVARFVPDAAAMRDPQAIAFLKSLLASATAAKASAVAEREQTAAVVNQARENLRNAESQIPVGGNGNAALQREQAQVAMRLIFKEIESMDMAVLAASQEIAVAEEAMQRLQSPGEREWEFHAPISGTILEKAESGKPIVAGTSLLEIGNPTDLEVIVEADAAAAKQVAAGQRVQLRRSPVETLQGRVRRVDLIPQEGAAADAAPTGKTRISIELTSLPEKWRTLGNRFPLQAQITIATIDNVLKVSSKALFMDNGKPAVYVIDNGRARKRNITRGAADAEAMVVESGLKEGERVIVSPGQNIQDGVRVTFQ